jgi:hypothetical protein
MTEHPITPPPTELVQQWINEEHGIFAEHLATRAAQWGADQELEACCGWLGQEGWSGESRQLRAARRPKPPSLKEQALEIVKRTPVNSAGLYSYEQLEIIRRALEQLDD